MHGNIYETDPLNFIKFVAKWSLQSLSSEIKDNLCNPIPLNAVLLQVEDIRSLMGYKRGQI